MLPGIDISTYSTPITMLSPDNDSRWRVVVVGNIVDGIQIWGPFLTPQGALDWVVKNRVFEFLIVPLEDHRHYGG